MPKPAIPILMILLLAVLAAPARAGIVYTLTPSGIANGLVFDPAGSDLVLTNSAATGDGAARFIDFGVGYDHTDGSGNVYYKPRTDVYQLYVLRDQLGGPDVYPPEAAAIFTGPAEAFNLGSGRYEFIADALVGATPFPDNRTLLDRPVTVDVTFDTRLPLGHQVESGTVTFGEPVAGSVPEPSSLALAAMGAVLAAVGRMVGLARRPAVGGTR